MNINSMFKEFALENLKSLPHPTARNKAVILNDLSSLCDLLIQFINFEVNEDSLQRIRSNFENHFDKIYNLDKKELASAIEGLATNFESFLKKIALIKFDDAVAWNGSDNYKGIKKCTLFELIEGKASKVDPRIDGPEFKDFPLPIVNNSGTSKGILDFVRSELRNSVHSANPYSRTQLIQYSNLVLGAYLIAINDNLDFFKKKFFPEFSYLEGIISNKEYSNLGKHYIDLYGKEDVFDFDNIAIEQLDGYKLIESLNIIEEEQIEEDVLLEDSIEEVARIDSVVNISKDTKRFILVGEPGSGKTTSLLKILIENAIGILNGSNGYRLPIYIKASSYSLINSFVNLISNEVNFMSFEDLHSKHKILILIDGLNEIKDDFKINAVNDLKELLSKYNDIDFIITSRKYEFFNPFNLSVYELRKLNENQIKQLIENVLDIEKGQKLWIQVEKNKQILDLASNPLMLMMIIKVSSLKNNEIPPNKGLLYKLFNDAILIREQKFYTTDIETKRDILSYIAFWMRNNGIFKNIKKVQAKELIRTKITEVNRSIGVNEILKELSDNNFFIEKSDELEFYHETQQEYFVALELQNLFFQKRSLEFDYSDNKWFEPILICSDLFTADEDRVSFFEQIFVGEKKQLNKRFHELDSSDVNAKFFIACKVAYNLKNIHPSLFKRAQIFLGNYLTIWHYRSNENILITDFENLIKSVASLSNEQIFKRFFYDLRNLEHLFCNKVLDNRTNNEEYHKEFDAKFNNYVRIFLENLSDYALLYKVFEEKKKAFNHIHSLSRSVFYNIRYFKRFLLTNSPTSQLIRAFKETNSLEILFEIGKSDLDFYIGNYFSTEGANDIDFYSFIGDYHIKNIAGINFLIKSLKDEKIETKTRLFILKKLLDGNLQIETVLNTLRELFYVKDVLMFFDEIKIFLSKFSIDLLSSFGLDVIYTNPAIEKIEINLRFIKESGNDLIFEAHNNRIDNKRVLKNVNNIYFNDRFIDFSYYLGSEGLLKLKEVISVTAASNTIKLCFDKYFSGGSFTIHYLDSKRHSITERYFFKEMYLTQNQSQILLEIDTSAVYKIKAIFNKFKKVKLLIGQEFSFSIKSFGSYHTSIYLKCDKQHFDVAESNTVFHLYDVNIDFSKPYNYHRDIIKSNSVFVRYIHTQIKKPEVINFVKAIGFCYGFASDLNDLKFGVVVGIYGDGKSYKICRLEKNRVTNRGLIKGYSQDYLKINDLVIIEDNLNISATNIGLIDDNYFLKSEIISTSTDRTEGFIAGIEGEKDYYFLSKYCNFSPHLGVIVKFIPGTNFSKNNSSRPMAYLISAFGNRYKLARVTKVVNNSNYTDVSFLDINSEQKLFSRIYDTQKILDFNGELSIGDIFSYYVPERFKGNYTVQRIYLIAKESFSDSRE
jgi:hypothetical protein